ncbi:MAG: aquaporin [Planctomycetes bacterium]|nr:aquaporin [Planctomycetota bacterium]
MENSLRRCVAEAIGTFCLVFAGTTAIVVDAGGGGVTHVGVSMVFGLVVFAMIAAVGDVSGAHLNPAVTFGFWLAGRFPAAGIAGYVVSQIVGGCLASGVVHLLFPLDATLGATRPAGTVGQAWALETVLTAILMYLILAVSSGSREKVITAGLAIGGMVTLEALLGGPVSGASMNPARSLAPAVVSGRLDHLWIYLTAPFVGAAVAVVACRCSRPAGCCEVPCSEESPA